MSQDNPVIGVDEQKAIDSQSEDTSQANQEEQQAVSEYNQEAKSSLSMKVKVYSPFKNYYEGSAFSLTAESATGPFDILPKHHNFISLLQPCDLIIRTINKGEQRIRISGGLIHVKSSQVIIFLDI